MKRKIEITVTEEHCRGAKKADPCNCPIARAVKQVVKPPKGGKVWVGPYGESIVVDYGGYVNEDDDELAPHTPQSSMFVSTYDKEGLRGLRKAGLLPLKLELSVPEEYVRS